MQSLGHAIIGDEFYDDQCTAHDSRLLLHARRLELYHPFTNAWIKFVAPLPLLTTGMGLNLYFRLATNNLRTAALNASIRCGGKCFPVSRFTFCMAFMALFL